MPVKRLSPKLSMSSRMKGKKQQFRELTPDQRPQDSHGDGTGLRFETGEHGGDYLDDMPPGNHGDRRPGSVGRIPVPLRTGGKIVASP